MNWGRYRRARGAALVAALLILPGLLFVVDPAETRLLPPCPFRLATGLYCPGCGSMRASHYLLHGDIVGALSMNPLMVCSLPVVGLLAWRRSWASRSWVPWMALITLVGYGVARNIELWPFTVLAPG